MDKTFDPAAVEARISTRWEEAEAFKAGREDRKGAEPYTIVIPPPNVTGSLHMGHALNNTIQDILCRFERMRGQGRAVAAGHGPCRHRHPDGGRAPAHGAADPPPRPRPRGVRQAGLGVEGGVRRHASVRQLKRLGASCDWSRERFTMDEGLSQAVLKVFVDLYKQGLIYKDKRLVNWDPKFQTAISDLEVQQVEVKGNLWHIRYAIEGEPDRFITVATTRPETMLGDVAVAVHPEDERYKDLIGKFAILPLVGRRIPIVADEYSDPEKGTGAVKITPGARLQRFRGRPAPQAAAHQHLRPRGATCARRQRGLPRRPAVDRTTSRPFWPSTASTASRRASASSPCWRSASSSSQIEPHTHTVPHGDRSGVVIEPYLTDQWYVNVKPLAERALGAVREGKTKFVPENWEKTYFQWLENIEPWCVSRQLWWGHQIPGLVRRRGQCLRRPERGGGEGAGARQARPRRAAHARRGRARHLVLLGAVAVLDPRLAGRDARARALLSDQHARHRLRHHLLLGRPHDDDGPALHGRGALRHGLHPRPRPRREGRQDVEVEGQRHRSARRDRAIRRRCPAHDARRHGGAGARHQAVASSASRATATSRPRSGTRRASPR